MDLGFLKIAAAVPSVKVGDCTYNVDRIAGMIHSASEQGVSIIAFPELSVTGYTCADLFGQPFCWNRQSRRWVDWSNKPPPTRLLVWSACRSLLRTTSTM